MSYMVAIKGINGFAIASDSYSCYYNRTLKDDNYKKIYKLENGLVIGMTGVNSIYYKNNLVDVGYLANLFLSNSITIEDVNNQIQSFLQSIQQTCDRECVDFSAVIYYKKHMWVIDILNNNNVFIKYYLPTEFDIVFLGEMEHKLHARAQFSLSDLTLSSDALQDKCIKSVQSEIKYEQELYDNLQQVVGGNVQSLIIPNKIP